MCASRLKRGPLTMQFYNHNGNKILAETASKTFLGESNAFFRVKACSRTHYDAHDLGTKLTLGLC